MKHLAAPLQMHVLLQPGRPVNVVVGRGMKGEGVGVCVFGEGGDIWVAHAAQHKAGCMQGHLDKNRGPLLFLRNAIGLLVKPTQVCKLCSHM